MNDRTRENLRRSFADAPDELTPDRIAQRRDNARELRLIDLEELGRCHATARAIGQRNDLELNVIADVEAELVALALRLRSRAV